MFSCTHLESATSADLLSERSHESAISELDGLSAKRVPIEVERLIDNDLVLEQFLSPASPMLAGFRLDGFSAISHM